VNVFLLSSISDATLMLDFCEVQHLKLNLSAALGRARRREIFHTAFNLRSKSVLLCASGVKKNGNGFLT
jgi:hypothetical protein